MNAVPSHLSRAPDLFRPLVGFRHWRLASGGLRSLVCDVAWPAATLTARCHAGGHHTHPPVGECSCGIYAWYRPCPVRHSEVVAGAVVLWGDVELHTGGMRAQHCRVVALALPLSRGRKRRRVCAVAERLGVPVVPHRALTRVVHALGAPVPDALKPPGPQVIGIVTR